jgi:uncharacterized protein (DUF433 family)
MDSVVVREPAIMSGEPTFRGTRVLVRSLFDYLEAGHSLERFLEGFPTVTRAMALQALEEAKESLLASRQVRILLDECIDEILVSRRRCTRSAIASWPPATQAAGDADPARRM